MININNLTKIYKSKSGYNVTALDGVSLNFGDRGLVFLLGKSGSGKTTLLNLIGGLDTPTSGELIIKGRLSTMMDGSDLDSYRNTYAGFVFQEYNLIDDYTVGGNVGLALELQGKEASREVIDECLRKVDLVDGNGNTLYDRRTNELSGGQKQRVAIARALVKSPELILADEPTGALDSRTGEQLYELFKELSKDKLVIVVTHDEESAHKYGDRVIELEDGGIISDTSPLSEDKPVCDDIKFVRSRLPVKRSFVMGLRTLKTKKIRLVFSVLLSVITFVMCGLSLVAGSMDEYTAELRTVYDNGYSMVGIEYSYGGTDVIKKYNNGKEPIMLSRNSMDYSRHTGSIRYSSYMQSSSDFTAFLDPVTGEADANLIPDKRFIDDSLCRLPQNSNEIAITDFFADMFMRFGYREKPLDYGGAWYPGKDEEEKEKPLIRIKTPDELIGKVIYGYTVTGVYSTEMDLDTYREYDMSFYDDTFINGITSSMRGSMMMYTFRCKDSVWGGNFFLLKLSGDIKKDRTLIDDLTVTNKYTEEKSEPRLLSPYSGFVNWIYYYKNLAQPFIQPIVIGVAAVFALLSVLLTMNFMLGSLRYRRKEFGIMRAIGARKKDVALACLIDSLFVAGLNFILTMITLLITCFALNSFLYVSVLFLGFAEIFLIILLCFGTSVLATLIPIYSMTKRKPVDIINNR